MTLPSHVGQYRILRKIGAGGMGLVYLGEHTLLGRRAAIKTLLPAVAANREIVERFFNEARSTSAIADPGVIQIFDFGYHVDGTAYIVMELLEGEALSARIERLSKLALGDALRFARQIAGSLGAAHACGIIHRDLKPENIFVVRDAEAQGGERTKIIDFGICKQTTSEPALTEAGAMVGTPVYMSPEQCRGIGDVDQRADIYAFGCLVFHLITGRPPFIGEASTDLIVAHLQQDPPPPSRYVPDLPPAIDALLLRCLAKSPAARFASMAEVQAALTEVASAAAKTQAAQPAPAATAGPTPPRTVPLGRGFRSMYDANFAARLDGSALVGADAPARESLRARLGLVQLSAAAQPPAEAEDDERPPRRVSVRAALACVVVVGVAIGLVVTPLISESQSDEAPPVAAQAPRRAALPGRREAEAAGAVAPPVSAPAAVVPAPRSADVRSADVRSVEPVRSADVRSTDVRSTDVRSAEPVRSADGRAGDRAGDGDPARGGDAARGGGAPRSSSERRAAPSKPTASPRVAISPERRAPPPSPSGIRTSRPVTSPAQVAGPAPRPVASPADLAGAPPSPAPSLPGAPAAVGPVPAAATSTSAAGPPAPTVRAAPPSPSSEDLYDSR